MFPYYNSPVIIPPVQPDVPGQGVPSDHSVPLCVPHTDPQNPPTREYKTVVSCPMPDSSIHEFGQWMISESWNGVTEGSEPTQQVKLFESIIEEKVDIFFPKKVTKIGVGQKPYITAELQTLKRKRMREYNTKGKSLKYDRLKEEFEEKLKKEGGKFVRKNMDSLKQTNPSKAYNILKKMGAQPGDCDETNSFNLPVHENLSVEEADKIAEHSSRISQEFPPLSMERLHERVTLNFFSMYY